MSNANVTMRECGGDRAAQALTVEEALRRIEDDVQPVNGVEQLSLRSALGRVLAEDILSPIDVPSHTNSAVDGYALSNADLPAGETIKLRVIGTSWAGRPFNGQVRAGECARIMTGAALPAGADTVVMQEQVQLEGDTMRTAAKLKTGENVRAAGEDLARGQRVLAAGKQILPPDLGLLASIGSAEVPVRRRVRVAFFSTGDELRSIGQPLAPGEIYDSNRYTLYGMLTRLGVDILDLGVVRDDRAATRQAFLDAAANADAIITSGGANFTAFENRLGVWV